MVRSQKAFGTVQFIINPYILGLMRWVPAKLIWFIMEESMMGGIWHIFLNNFHQGMVIEVLDNVLLCARVPSTMMEGDAYLDGLLFPSTIAIKPFTICLGLVTLNIAVAQLLIDQHPVCISYIFWVISWMSYNILKLPEAGSGLLMPLLPIPIP